MAKPPFCLLPSVLHKGSCCPAGVNGQSTSCASSSCHGSAGWGGSFTASLHSHLVSSAHTPDANAANIAKL